MNPSPDRILHDAHNAKFYTKDGACLQYSREANVLSLDHTFVPKHLRGQKLAERLLKEALTYSESIHAKVRPECTFAKAYLDQHQHLHHLLEAPSNSQ